MKIRNGFVSNSSSSSFIIDIPNEDLTLDKVSDFYKFKDGLDETTKGLMTYTIWRIVNEVKRRDAFQLDNKDEYYDYDFVDLGDGIETDAEISDDFVKSCEWCAENDYFLKEGYSDKYTESVIKMKNNGLRKARIEVDNSSWDSGLVRILSGKDQSRLDEKSEYIFDKNADEIHAIGINQH